MAWESNLNQPMILLIVGPSCAGKTTLLKLLLSTHPDVFESLVGFTTRKIRAGEVDGEEYRYLTEEQAAAAIDSGDICQSVTYNGVSYGTMKSDLQRIWNKGKVPVRIVEPTGVCQFEQATASTDCIVFSVFVNAPKVDIMARWLSRFEAQMDKTKVSYEQELQFFASRILLTVEKEFKWVDQYSFNFYAESSRPMHDYVYALYRICSGKVPKDMMNRIFPKPMN